MQVIAAQQEIKYWKLLNLRDIHLAAIICSFYRYGSNLKILFN